MRRLILACVLLGCSSKEPNPEPQLATIESCDGLTVPRAEGGCVTSGITSCPAGFVGDAGSCKAILPDTKCSRATMALPGETTCRPVATCATGDWYDAPEDAIHVDVASTTVTPDGTIAHPYAKIQDALDAAPDGATIALADGSYPEAISIKKKVTIIGRCPSKASIEAPAGTFATVDVQAPADMRRLAVTGPGLGISVYETEGFVGDQLWIHDTGSVGFDVERKTKTASGKLTRSLIESPAWGGVIGIGGKIDIEASSVRDTRRLDDDRRGLGIFTRSEGTETGSLRVSGSLVERVREWGIAAQSSSLTVENTLVRGVAEDVEFGAGIVSAARPELMTTGPFPVTLKGVVIEEVVGGGVLLDHSDGTIAGLTIRSMHHGTNKHSDGFGIVIERSTMAWNEGAVEGTELVALAAIGAKATLDRILVRDVVGLSSTKGVGIYAGDDDKRNPAELTLRDSRADRVSIAGLMVVGSSATVARCVFASIIANDDGYGDGINVGGDWDSAPMVRANVLLDMV
ncbi:MAG: hypothetical protein ACXWUG_11925, partial [Polyangiales bacterium]